MQPLEAEIQPSQYGCIKLLDVMESYRGHLSPIRKSVSYKAAYRTLIS